MDSQHKFLNYVEYNSHQGANETISYGSQWSTSVYGDQEQYGAKDQGANQNEQGKAQGARSNVEIKERNMKKVTRKKKQKKI